MPSFHLPLDYTFVFVRIITLRNNKGRAMSLTDFFPTKQAWKRMAFGFFFGHSAETLEELKTQTLLQAYVETAWGLAAVVGGMTLLCNLIKLVFC